MKTSVVLLVLLAVGHVVMANNEATPAPSVAKDLMKKVFSGALASPHIVGGGQVKPHSLPHQVALAIHLRNNQSFCGGSLIAPQWVLTAAHCVTNSINMTAFLGVHNLERPEKGKQIIEVEKYFKGGRGTEVDVNDDIALLRLKEPAVLSNSVNTIRLPSLSLSRKVLTGMPVVISGWGRFNDRTKAISPFLRAATSRIIDKRLCNFYFEGQITNRMLCIDGSEGRGVCQGDSGGPLTMTESDGERTLIGITSFGSTDGCESGSPTVFTRVDQYLQPIAKYTGIKLRK